MICHRPFYGLTFKSVIDHFNFYTYQFKTTRR